MPTRQKLILVAAGSFAMVLMTTGHQSYGQTGYYGGVPTGPVMHSLTTGSRSYSRSRGHLRRSRGGNYYGYQRSLNFLKTRGN